MTATASSALHIPTHPVRFVTAASLFDGHDAAINVMRRLLQSQGAEVVHLGHDRSVDTVVRAAVEEDVQGVAISSGTITPPPPPNTWTCPAPASASRSTR